MEWKREVLPSILLYSVSGEQSDCSKLSSSEPAEIHCIDQGLKPGQGNADAGEFPKSQGMPFLLGTLDDNDVAGGSQNQ